MAVYPANSATSTRLVNKGKEEAPCASLQCSGFGAGRRRGGPAPLTLAFCESLNGGKLIIRNCNTHDPASGSKEYTLQQGGRIKP